MEDFIIYGYWGLFAASFLAATLLPLSSEVVLGLLLMNGADPVISVAVATCGNVLGSCLNYAIGLGGNKLLLRKVLRISEDEFNKSAERYKRWGVYSLLLAWVPVIGDPITVVAGVLRTKFMFFLILVTTGKLARYIVITLIGIEL